MRQEAIEQLVQLQSLPSKPLKTNNPIDVLNNAIAEISCDTAINPGAAQLHVLVRNADQLDAAISVIPDSITLDYLELYGLRESIEKIRQAGITPRVASPRILKPQEQKIVNFLLRLDCQILVRSGGLLEALQGRYNHPLIGDFSLNAANQISADTYFKLGVSKITPTHDLNADQICKLADEMGGDRFEVIAYQHLPVFHTEHCVFCRFLSNGTSSLDCGHPCERHRVALRDDRGRLHPVMADVGCRNTVFGAEAQVASKHMGQMMASGIVHYRLEFVHETADAVRRAALAFKDYLAGRINTVTLDQRLQKVAPQGTTEGSLFVPDNYLKVPTLQG